MSGIISLVVIIVTGLLSSLTSPANTGTRVDLNRGTICPDGYSTLNNNQIYPHPLFNPKVPLVQTRTAKALPAPTFQDSLNFHLLGDYNLAGNYLNMSGWQVRPYRDYIVMSSGGGFYVFTKDSLRKVQEISGPGYIWDFEIRDTLVFSASGDKGLVVYNFAALNGDRVVSQLDIPYEDPNYNEVFGWGATGIELLDSFALITVRVGGFYVVNIADPRNPRIVAQNIEHDWLMDVHVIDTFAYVTQYGPDDNDAFLVYSVANPANPRVVSVLTTLQKGMRFCIRDTIAYVPGRYNGVAVLSIANPHNPVLLGTLDALEAQNITLLPRGDTLYGYVANLDNLIVADFSDPRNPSEITTVNVRSTADFIEGNLLYHQGLAGAVLYDITYPYNPRLDTFYVYLGNPYYLQVAGSHAYIYDSYGCLRILDISQPDDITELAYYDRFLDSIPSGSWTAGIGGMVIYNNHAYLIVRGYPWFCYLAIVKVSDPHNPDWVGTKMWRGYAGGNQPFVEDTLAYVPTALSGQTYLRIIDIGDPAHIEDIGMFFWSTWAALEVTKKDTLLFLAGGYDPYGGTQQTFRDLGIVNIARPWLPQLLTEFTSPNQCRGVDRFTSTPHLALADYAAGVHILDISNPTSPYITGTIGFQGYVEDVHIGRNMVFCSADEQFAGIDAANRTSPQLYGYYYLMPKFSRKYAFGTDVWSIDDSIGAVITTGGLFLFRTGYLGISEKNPIAARTALTPTLINGVLNLKSADPNLCAALLDAAGRKVLNLKTGTNDLTHLAPGVYFIQRNHSSKPEPVILVK